MPINIKWIETGTDSAITELSGLRQRLSPEGEVVSEAGRQKTMQVFGEAIPPSEVVKRICNDVSRFGLDSLLRYTRAIDGVDLTPETLRVPEAALRAAHAEVDPAFLQSVRRIRERIEHFQRSIKLENVRVPVPGGYLEQRYRPLRRVGICVPGGVAAYPSTVLMTVVPAQVAGVREIALMAPPTRFGSENTHVLATCYELGVTEILRIGGAQGVAALAYGVEGIPRVDKIVGPGNLFVALAKKHVFGAVSIDSIAGPSEVVVIVDSTTRPKFTALDLIAQAEHAPGASIVVGWERQILEAIVLELDRLLENLDRGNLARQSLEEFGAVVLVRNREEACALTDQIAPEHLHIATERPEELAERILCAGAVFLGNYSPVALGDYAAGPSHVLPTSGTARFASGLTVNDFLRGHSVLCFDREGMVALAEDVRQLAESEGLTAHRDSVLARLEE